MGLPEMLSMGTFSRSGTTVSATTIAAHNPRDQRLDLRYRYGHRHRHQRRPGDGVDRKRVHLHCRLRHDLGTDRVVPQAQHGQLRARADASSRSPRPRTAW
jgi:hypothetical protein